MEPKLYFGGTATLYEYDSGHQDAGQAITGLAQPNAVAPAGVGGECLFTLLYLTLSWTMATSVKIVPVLDGVRFDGVSEDDESTTITLAASTRRQTKRFEIFLGRNAKWPDGTVFGRRAMRGVWFTYEITATAADGTLVCEGSELEVEVVRESATAA